MLYVNIILCHTYCRVQKSIYLSWMGKLFQTFEPYSMCVRKGEFTCMYSSCLSAWNEAFWFSSPGCQPSVPSTSYITLTGHFTPGFRIPVERPPQTLWVVPPQWECHSHPAEQYAWTFADWPQSQICLTGENYDKWFLCSSFFTIK